ncbi:glycosyltransferase family 2 protein [Flavobacterium sp. GN10]|uniref:Glycosyltransferase family 2 protein n=1 Tax=Flavobacterium tagetis TaxID=2801336 RepID=A0ABS1KHC6_9FLAO|nr:glycosyltransferase family 2 protein [Flavobacterium tagetis]MBL0738880.1 glycosyltransferase family 2 protein [Flavobacterium tagetis]
MHNPTISIIIPTYNRAYLIRETLDSILAQTYRNWECIVIDDGSTDNTEDLLREFIDKDNRFQYYKRPAEKLKGPNSCRNYGYEKSKGELIQFFDSDDIMKANCLEIKSSFFLESIDLVICKLSLYDFERDIEIKQSNIVSDDLIFDYFSAKVALYISGPLWRKSFLGKRSVLFDESIINCDDWDFNMKMLYFDPKYIICDKALILYRKHQKSLSVEVEVEEHFAEVKKVSDLLDNHLILLKNNKTTELNKFYKYAVDYNKSHLKKAILQNDKVQFFLLFRISRYSLEYNFWLIFFEVWIIKIFHFFFWKAYCFLKQSFK